MYVCMYEMHVCMHISIYSVLSISRLHYVLCCSPVQDNTRPYWPSSPSNGAIVDDRDRQLYIQRWGESGNTLYGDIHR